MRTYIKVSDPLRRDLCVRFKVTRATVWSALNYITRGGRSPYIRQYALEHGGAIVEDDFIPNCRTEHTGDEMIQTFPGGIQVRISKVDSGAQILKEGKVTERYDAVTLQGWSNLLSHAQDLSAKQVAKSMSNPVTPRARR